MLGLHYKRYVLGILLSVHAFITIDRQILALLMEPIRQDLQLSDAQLGFISGIAFAIFYVILGIPIARLADRSVRVNVISVALTLWGCIIAISGLATTFWQLAVARIAIGVGEAGSTPSAYSIISDYFSKLSRSSAISIYMVGAPLGTLLAFLVGGWINELYGWRVVFLALGIPGLILAAFVKLTVREPIRGQFDNLPTTNSSMENSSQYSLIDTLSYLWKNRCFRRLVIAVTLTIFVSTGVGQWAPTFFARYHNMGTGELGSWLAILVGVFGFIGIFFGGYLIRRFARDNESLQMRAIAVTTIVMMIPGVISLLCPDKHVSLLLRGFINFFVFLSTGPAFALLIGLVPSRMRATAFAIVLLIANLVGAGVGPQVVGILSDFLSFYFGENSLKISLILMFFAAPPAAWNFWLAGNVVNENMIKINSEDNFKKCTIKNKKVKASIL